MAITYKKLIRLQTLVLVIGLILMAAKFLAYFLTRSNSILTDALESIVNVLAGAFGLFSLYLSSLPRDINHPYGHGKIEFISGGFEGGMVAAAGLVIAVKAIYNLFHPVSLQKLDIGLAITAGTGAINFLMGMVTERHGKNSHSIALESSGKHLKSDAYSSLGIIIGLGLIWLTGWNWLDNIVALVFGGIILYMGAAVVRQSLAGIMDEADYKALQQVLDVLNAHRRPNWIDFHNMRIIKYGSLLHIDTHLTLPWYLTVEEAHDEVERIDQLVRTYTARDVEFFIHIDPCLHTSCTLCQKEECHIRQATFNASQEWTLENVMPNRKHGIQ